MIRPLVLLLLVASLGCQAAQKFKLPKNEEVARREAREAEATRRFEQRRQAIQMEVAVDAWKAGNLDRCEEVLVRLVDLDPENCRARLMLAELYLLRDQPEQSSEQMQRLTEKFPDHAHVWHMLGLAEEAQGNQQAALASYEKALQLEPENELLQASYTAAVEDSTLPDPR